MKPALRSWQSIPRHRLTSLSMQPSLCNCNIPTIQEPCETTEGSGRDKAPGEEGDRPSQSMMCGAAVLMRGSQLCMHRQDISSLEVAFQDFVTRGTILSYLRASSSSGDVVRVSVGQDTIFLLYLFNLYHEAVTQPSSWSCCLSGDL